MTGDGDPPTFTLAAGVVALAGCLLAVAAPFVGSPPDAFQGSVSASGLVGTVFAAQHLQVIRDRGRPGLPAATVTTVFGGAYLLAPLLYRDVGFVATASAQFAGLLTAAFGGYGAVEAVEDLLG